MPMMAMSFFFGLQRPLLFSTWNLNNAGGKALAEIMFVCRVTCMISSFNVKFSELVGAIIVVLIFAILYELLKTARELLMYYDLQRIQRELPGYRRVESREKLMMDDNDAILA